MDGRDGQPSEWYRVAVCSLAYCVPRVSVKIHRSVGREGELRRAALPGGSERDGLVDIKHFFMHFRSRQRVSVRTRRNRRDTLATR